MKKRIAALLLIVMFAQVLPLNALATIGKVLTKEELEAAYALTGLESGGLDAIEANSWNGAYHEGMMPNARWNAAQLEEWLDERLDVHLEGISNTLSMAAYTMSDLRQSDPSSYEGYAAEPFFSETQDMYLEVEGLREEMRLYSKRLTESSNMIEQMKNLMEQDDVAMFDSDKVRYSARIETAVEDIEATRQVIVENSAAWQDRIDTIQARMRSSGADGAPRGAGEGGTPGDWLSRMSTEGSVVSDTVPVSKIATSNSRLSRLETTGGLTTNGADASIMVITESVVAISLVYGDDLNRKGIGNVPVYVKDMLNSSAGEQKYISDVDTGVVVVPINNLTTDEFDLVHLTVSIDPREQGFQEIQIDDMDLARGEILTLVMKPLAGTNPQGNAGRGEEAVQQPYVTSMEFNNKDIMYQKYEMTASELNDYNFDIKVKIANPANVKVPDLVMTYYKTDSSWRNITTAEASVKKVTVTGKRDGDTYTFTGPWKMEFSPFANENQRPYFSFGENASESLTFRSRLVSKRSATQAPISDGAAGILSGIFDDGLGFSCVIPGVDMTLGFNLPIRDWYPKISINPGGYATGYMGSNALANKLMGLSNAKWRTNDQKTYDLLAMKNAQITQKQAIKAKVGADKDWYSSIMLKFMGEFKINFGMYGLGIVRWPLDESVPDVMSRDVSGSLVVGFTAGLYASWAVSRVPFTLTFSMTLTVGVAIQFQVSFCLINGKLENWALKPLRDVTLTITLILGVQLGVGVKGIFEVWVKGTSTLNIIILFTIIGGDPLAITITWNLRLTVGMTIVFGEITKFWDWGPGQIWPSTNANDGLLGKYMNEGGEDEEEEIIDPELNQGEPLDYPNLAAKARAVKQDIQNGIAGLRVAEAGGDPYMFYIAPVKGKNGETHQRVHWVNISTNATGSVQDDLDAIGLKNILTRDDYGFDVYTANGFLALVVMSARDFDEDGNPIPNDYSQSDAEINAHCYYMMLENVSGGRLSSSLTYKIGGSNRYAGSAVVRQKTTSSQYNFSYNTATRPHISYALAVGKNDSKKTITRFDIYGECSTVSTDPDKPGIGGTIFVFQSGKADKFFTDRNTECGKGTNYQRVQLCSTMVGEYAIKDDQYNYSPSFVSLTRPEPGKQGKAAIDMFDFGMNGNKNIRNRQAVVLQEGDIDFIRVVMGKRDDGWVSTVFYAEQETDADGATRYRLFSLFIEPLQKSGSNKVSFNVTKYQFDVVMPTNYFNVFYLGETPYIYWLAADDDPDERVEDSTNWRVWTMAYDPASAMVAAPNVFAQFKLPLASDFSDDGSFINYAFAPHDLLITTKGQGYTLAVPSDQIYPDRSEEAHELPHTMSLFNFPVQLTTSAIIDAAVPQELAIKPGDFEDMALGIMNDGNTGLVTMDVAMYEVDPTTDKTGDMPVGVVHINALNSDLNKLTLPGKKTDLSDGKVVQTGKKAAFRLLDFGYTSRQSDYVLKREKKLYGFTLGSTIKPDPVQDVDPTDPKYVTNSILLPGSKGAFTAVYKIPDSWEGKKKLRMMVVGTDIVSNLARAMARSAGLTAEGVSSNDAGSAVLHYELNPDTGKLELQMPPQANGELRSAVESGIIANEMEPSWTDVTAIMQDLNIRHREYEGHDGQEWIDITIRNAAASRQGNKLVCAVYLDYSEEPYYVQLPYYENATASRRTQNISLPISALVENPEEHSIARVVIKLVDQAERASIDNEFYLTLGGTTTFRITEQPRDITSRAGEKVSFSVTVAGGTQPYRYQWQVFMDGKWVNVGENSNALLLPEVKAEWDGRKARCIISDGGREIKLDKKGNPIIKPEDEGHILISDEAVLHVAEAPDTGDHSNLPMYLIVALIALAALVVLRRKQRTGRY